MLFWTWSMYADALNQTSLANQLYQKDYAGW